MQTETHTSSWWFQTLFSIMYCMSSCPLTFICFKKIKTTNQVANNHRFNPFILPTGAKSYSVHLASASFGKDGISHRSGESHVWNHISYRTMIFLLSFFMIHQHVVMIPLWSHVSICSPMDLALPINMFETWEDTNMRRRIYLVRLFGGWPVVPMVFGVHLCVYIPV